MTFVSFHSMTPNGELYVYTVDYGRFLFPFTHKVAASWAAESLH